MVLEAQTNSAPHAHDSDPLRSRLRRGGVWIVGARTVGMVTVFAVHLVLAHILPTKEYAAFVLVSSIALLFSMAAMFGLNTLVCRYVAESLGVKDAARACKAIHLTARIGVFTISGVGLAGGVCVMLLGDFLFQLPHLGQSAALVALWIMLLAISQILAEVYRGLHDLKMASILGGVSGGLATNALFLLGLMAACCFTPLDLRAVVLLATASLILPIAWAVACLFRSWPRDEDQVGHATHALQPLSTTSVMREAVPVMLVQVVSFGLAQLDIWIVGICCADAELAVYAVARRLSLLVAIPLTQVGLVVASSISELHAQRDRQRLELTLRAAATVSFIATALVAFLLIGFPSVVLEWTFGPPFRAGATPLRILCVGQILFALTGPCGPALMMTGQQRVTLWSLIATVPIFFLGPWAATHLGVEAMAMISATANAVRNGCQWLAVRVLLGLGTHPFLRTVLFLTLTASWLSAHATDGGAENRSRFPAKYAAYKTSIQRL